MPTPPGPHASPLEIDQAAVTPATLQPDFPQEQPPRSRDRVSNLTPREIEVLHLVAEGLTNKQVAHRLSITPVTVNVHLTSIYSKLGVSGRVAATTLARERGLIAKDY
jgi:DNA-binding NarL/FixJ family response regulator